jgi:hypothetical protein
LPQGSLKKIEFDLLLTDLALKLADALARRHKILARLKIEDPKSFARPARRPQCLGSTSPEMPAPFV